MNDHTPEGAVYVQTNDAADNQVVAYRRSAEGALQPLGSFSTGDADAQRVHAWSVGGDGRLAPVGAFEGVPETVAGLAAS
jgi:hypothetical protein